MSDPVPGEARLAAHATALSGLLESLFTEAPVCADTPIEAALSEAAEVPEATDSAPDDLIIQPPTAEVSVGLEADGRVPDWAQDPFRALLFRVGGFRFAMPLILMRSIFGLPDKITRLPAQPVWHRGLVRYRDQCVAVVDLGSLFGVHASCVAPRYLLLIGDGHAALECDEIEDALVVDPKAVRWSKKEAGRSWMAGLIPHQMCGLLDADAITEQIRHG